MLIFYLATAQSSGQGTGVNYPNWGKLEIWGANERATDVDVLSERN